MVLLVLERASLARWVSADSFALAFLDSATSGERRLLASPGRERFIERTQSEVEEGVVHLVAHADGESLERQRAVETFLSVREGEWRHMDAKNGETGGVCRHVENDKGAVGERRLGLLVVDGGAEMAGEDRGVGEFWSQWDEQTTLAFRAHRRM